MCKSIMKILVTGSTGFIGRNLKEQLEDKYEIYTPDHRELDLLDDNKVERYLKNMDFDIIIHCANRNDVVKVGTTDYDVLDDNLRMFYNLERCSEYYGKMYYFGSGAEYSSAHYIPNMTEDYFGTHVPRDPYGFSKYIMSKTCRKDGNLYDLRLFGVYGKYEEWSRRFISNAICRGLKGMPITLSQNVYFDYLWIEDLVEIMKWFIENEPRYKHYNVCRGTRIDLYTLACKVRQILNIDCDILVAKDGFKTEYTGCNQRLQGEMGEISFSPWDLTIEKLCEYYKENLDQIDADKLI